MRLWVDNTSIHSAGRCIAGLAKGENDLSSLLQLATQIAFSEKIYMNAFEASSVGDRTVEIVFDLIRLGVPPDLMVIAPVKPDVYAKLCIRGANRLSDDLQYSFEEGVEASSGLLEAAAPDISIGQNSLEEKAHEFIINGVSDGDRENISQHALHQKAAGAGVYMLVGSTRLWEQIQVRAKEREWTKTDTARILVYLRYYLNEELSGSELRELPTGLEYAPSVSRSRIVSKQNNYVLQNLSRIVGDAAKCLEPVLVGAPSISHAVALRSKGSPLAVIEEAVKIRNQSEELRSYITKLAEKDKRATEKNEHAELSILRKGIRALGSALHKELGVTNAPSCLDALEIQFVGMYPVPSIGKLTKWLSHVKSKKRVVVLSELARDLANQRLDPMTYKKLLGDCCRGKLEV